MASYLFVLGRTPSLALLELSTFFSSVTPVGDDVVSVDTKDSLDSTKTLDTLGGTVKIAEEVGTVSELTAQNLVQYLPKVEHQLAFGLSLYGVNLGDVSPILQNMKDQLTLQGQKSRFVLSRHGSALTSVVVAKNRVTELIIVNEGTSYRVGKTVAVQPFEQWGDRDYSRPHADAKAGMLPPKVARMVVNIAGKSTPDAPKTLLDPFCGMGTILGEAVLMGWQVYGSDLSAGAVAKAKENMAWLMKRYPGVPGSVRELFVSEAVHVSGVLPVSSIDAIVTEPFMGSTAMATRQVSQKEVQDTIRGLEKLYIGCLKDWHKVLKPGGIIVIALPEYAISGRVYFVKRVIDMCENLGYTIETGPIAYGREHAMVRRVFYTFKKIS